MRLQIRYRTAPPQAIQATQPSKVRVRTRPLRVLDFDLENRPLTYLGSDYTTAEITAIAWAWCDKPQDVTCVLLGEMTLRDMLLDFMRAYNQADVVCGHFLRGHDLLMVNSACIEQQLPALSDKYVQDTKVAMIRGKGISRSQESLAAMLGLECPKVHMTQADWREANRLTPAGLARRRERVVGDVRQNIELRAEMLKRGWLGPPTLWRSGSATVEQYTP
jgi:hypothetical protein